MCAVSTIELMVNITLLFPLNIFCLEVCHPRCVCVKNWKGYVVKQQCQLRCFNDYTRQLHVSAPTGHLQVVFKGT
jgi:hypothetical protein